MHANDRVEQLLAGFDAPLAPHRARALAEELVRTIVMLYGDALERILETADHDLGDRSEPFFERLCRDKFVESVLCLHGLHPIALEDRIQRAIASVLPYIKSHHGNIAVSRIASGVVYLRLEGSCDGCPASAATLKLAVERAIREWAPEIREVRAEESAAAVQFA